MNNMITGNQDSKDIGELKANIASTLENILAILGKGTSEEELTLEEQVRNALSDILVEGTKEEGGFNEQGHNSPVQRCFNIKT